MFAGRCVDGRRWCALSGAARRCDELAGIESASTPGSYLTEVIGGELNLSFGGEHVFAATSDHKLRLFASDRCLDVGVGLGTKRLDFAALATHYFGHVLR